MGFADVSQKSVLFGQFKEAVLTVPLPHGREGAMICSTVRLDIVKL